MTRKTQMPDEKTFERAWTAFMRDDRGVTFPPGLEERILSAARAGTTASSASRARRRILAIGMAAAILLSIVIAREMVQRSSDSPHGAPSVHSSAADPLESAALVIFAADPVRETEVMHLVRVRMSRAALATLIPTEGSDEATLVDVDVLIGEDGLPRDIRRIGRASDAHPSK